MYIVKLDKENKMTQVLIRGYELDFVPSSVQLKSVENDP